MINCGKSAIKQINQNVKLIRDYQGYIKSVNACTVIHKSTSISQLNAIIKPIIKSLSETNF